MKLFKHKQVAKHNKNHVGHMRSCTFLYCCVHTQKTRKPICLHLALSDKSYGSSIEMVENKCAPNCLTFLTANSHKCIIV